MSFCYEESTEAVDRWTVGVDWTVAAAEEATPGQTGATCRLESSLFRGYFMDSANRSGVAFPAGRVSFSFHLLAATAAMGGPGRLAGGLANVAGRTRPKGTAEVGWSFSRRQFRTGEKGGSAVGKTKRGKGTKWMVLVDGEGIPLGVRLESASPNEVTLAEATLDQVRVPRPKGRPRQKPQRVIADRAYDSDPLRQRLKKRGIELIVPYRENNKLRRYEDGRKLRRYKRRWIVERTNAWLGQFRRLLVRHENLLSTYRAFFYLACLWITLRRYFWNTLY
jgi:transposase